MSFRAENKLSRVWSLCSWYHAEFPASELPSYFAGVPYGDSCFSNLQHRLWTARAPVSERNNLAKRLQGNHILL